MNFQKLLLLLFIFIVCKSHAQSGLTIATSIQNVSCYSGSNGRITATVSGGSGSYDYRLAQGSAAGWGTSNIFSSLSAGTYPVSVRDRNNPTNIKTVYVDITQPAQFIVSGTAAATTCSGSTDGAINLTVSGGTAPYTYAWTQNNIAIAPTSQNLKNLAPGVYNAIVTDANGCQQQITSNQSQIISPLKLTGYNIDGIANGTNTTTSSSGSNSTVTSPLDKVISGYNGANFYVNGYKYRSSATAYSSNGLPTNGEFISALSSAHPFALDNYSDVNTLHLDGNTASGKLKLSEANFTAYQNLFVLATSCNGSSSLSYQVVYTDSTKTNSTTTTITDWNGGTANVALGSLKRLNYTGSSVGRDDGSGAIFNIYEFTIPLTLNNKKVAYISFSNSSTGQANIFGITGQTYTSTGLVVNAGSTETKTPSVTISNNQGNNTFCLNENITLTSSAKNVGANPSYQWYLGNTVINGATDSVYTPTLNTSTTKNYKVVVTTDATVGCVTSQTATNSLTLTNGSIVPSVAISGPTSSICEGTTAQFIASPVNGGASPSYSWYVNGSFVTGNTGNSYSTKNLINGKNTVYAILNSSINCASPNNSQSNNLVVLQSPTVEPTISIFGREIPTGSKNFVYYIQDSSNLGTSPTYQWLANDNSISGANQASYTAQSPVVSDLYSLSVQSSLACASPVKVMSNYVSPTFILPITLESFVVTLNKNIANVNWVTSMEKNVSKFNIWRSFNNQDFEIVATKNALNASLGASYNSLDTLGNNGVYYYYLESVDLDGNKQKSSIISLNYSGSLNSNSRMYPNPFVNQIHIEFTSNFNTTANVLVYSLSGAIVYQKNVNLYSGNNSITIDNINNLVSGVYAIKIVDIKNKQTLFQSKAIKK